MNVEKILNDVANNLKDQKELEYFEIHIERYKTILETINKLSLPKNAKILDIGCYPPHISDSLKAMGYDVYGISSYHETINSSKVKNINIENAKLPYADSTFDFVLITEVVEHLTGHLDCLFSEIKRILVPGGKLLLTTPNAARIQNLVLLLMGKNIYFPLFQLNGNSFEDGSIYYRHNREYTASELASLLKSSGFNQIACNYEISYTPQRKKNRKDNLLLKITKFLNYLISLIFVKRRDTLYLVCK